MAAGAGDGTLDMRRVKGGEPMADFILAQVETMQWRSRPFEHT